MELYSQLSSLPILTLKLWSVHRISVRGRRVTTKRRMNVLPPPHIDFSPFIEVGVCLSINFYLSILHYFQPYFCLDIQYTKYFFHFAAFRGHRDGGGDGGGAQEVHQHRILQVSVRDALKMMLSIGAVQCTQNSIYAQLIP